MENIVLAEKRMKQGASKQRNAQNIEASVKNWESILIGEEKSSAANRAVGDFFDFWFLQWYS